ncbi:uncharacterized protein Z518_10033 [Rhinocladiella mackenziei CBS 650.93]|uniref:Rhinocladiella mackenziei CBS 650.93 unplaced genomic scaffold supercont1.8, whole genome shotgun sequence n=1 Tax=Rhinocladiella mackenziei CBS 650.93 TaxID=1442369 RepID=A0A0D2FG51_9EURO|nr:uncharacterized protein Z518_10033 [Rhinocladiella mackenziei CBS 650.93]KIX00967.1 hypothetical protein Z518_10033 [Rhinocladiella mackenziei CBS 650.93]
MDRRLTLAQEEPLASVWDAFLETTEYDLFAKDLYKNSVRVVLFERILLKLHLQINRIRRTLRRGRNVDAVDGLAQMEFYYDQATVGLQHSLYTIRLLREAQGAMMRIWLPEDQTPETQLAKEDLGTVFEALMEHEGGEAATAAIFQTLLRKFYT